ncbi:4-hydroxyphenylpyruvate dioxygenase-like protein [Saccoglossus kowalevskii]|uniref:4-hydroxyphenylpyruvate dioxygenase n=1 Tax=Saccoglossus kowalevskii TaxID=10224 RepID=A0ABM0GR87_SACKO|nr:PREDICTED: 4-hydroxyphenylpyruvate dioxygenase-like protein-like [Saccoglossus kowalevskii]
MAATVHHVRISVRNGPQMLKKFTKCLGFRLFAERRTVSSNQWAVRSGSAIFVIIERPCSLPATGELCERDPDQEIMSRSNSHREECCPHVNSVYDVTFQVSDVDRTFSHARDNGAKVLETPHFDEDDLGRVRRAVVKSCVGDVVHTLLDTSEYTGSFLPGFKYIHDKETNNVSSSRDSLSHFDHVTYACPMGATEDILMFYEHCFGLKRFLVNRSEDVTEGYVVKGEDMAMRLKAMQYWKCAETHLGSVESSSTPQIKFVIAEPLPGQGPNQVETFLRNHGGAGIQHIGLHTSDIVASTAAITEAGLPLIVPPDAYYTEIGKLHEIQYVGENVDLMQKYCILLDSEADAGNTSNTDVAEGHRYLMQVFTQPIFEEDTFFLELIQRHGATGFGAGNITALWRSVQVYMNKQESKRDLANKS